MLINPHVLAKAVEESHVAPIAETELATILAKEWCSGLGGWPSESDERMAQIWSFRPQARKLLAAIKGVAKTDRQALARFVTS